MNEWKEYKFSDVLIDESISYGIVQPGFHKANGVPIVRVNNIKNGYISTDEVLRVDESVESKYQRTRLGGGELLITVVGSVGECAIVPSSLKGWNVARAVSVARIKSSFDTRFIKYCFRLDGVTHQLYGNTNDTVQPTLNLSLLKGIVLNLPPLPTQTAIAEILSSLDDKIDLLHRQNLTLEQLAETLFRKWFVEEAEESWEEKSLFESINLIGGGTPKTDKNEYWNGNIKWLAGGDIASSHRGFVTNTEKTITELGLQNSSAKLLPEFSTVISARGTVGKYCLLSEPMTFSQSNYGITPKFKNCFFFTYLLVAYSVEELQAAAYGSVFDTITTNTFKEHKIKLPDESSVKGFEEQVSPFFQKIKSNSQQILTLTRLRDTLLPKLMSGAVSLSNCGEVKVSEL